MGRQLQAWLWRSITIRTYATASPLGSVGPPLLARVREDMKVAMKAKNKAQYVLSNHDLRMLRSHLFCSDLLSLIRLDVLRGLISDATNATKTSNPITTDYQMLQVIRKRVKSCEGAAKEAEDAKREDLRDKELQQITVLEGYIKDSSFVSEENVKMTVQKTIGKIRTEGGKADKANVMKALIGQNGALDGQLVDKKLVAAVVDGML